MTNDIATHPPAIPTRPEDLVLKVWEYADYASNLFRLHTDHRIILTVNEKSQRRYTQQATIGPLP